MALAPSCSSINAVIYTDGACKNNQSPEHTRRAGIGVWWAENDPRNLSETLPGHRTNNRAELVAIARALETTAEPPQAVEIWTDSNYSKRCLTEWSISWAKNGWKKAGGKQAPENLHEIKYILALIEERSSLVTSPVNFVWVRGHNKEVGNEGADRLANAGCDLPHLSDRDWVALEQEVRNRMTARACEQAELASENGAKTLASCGVAATSRTSSSASPVVSASRDTTKELPWNTTTSTARPTPLAVPITPLRAPNATSQTPSASLRAASPISATTGVLASPRTPSSQMSISAHGLRGGGPKGYEQIAPSSWELEYTDDLFLGADELRALELSGWEIDGRV